MMLDWIMGIDEVGRGPLAGPVVSTAALLCFTRPIPREHRPNQQLWDIGVKDSKKLSANKRAELLDHFGVQPTSGVQKLKTDSLGGDIALGLVATALGSVEEIDELNILRATHLSMERAFELLSRELSGNGLILIDGNLIPEGLQALPSAGPVVEAVIKGDGREGIIALASIFAKSTRDLMMEELEGQYPGYGFARHAGYPTAYHCEALKKLGVSPCHRRSFKTVRVECEQNNWAESMEQRPAT
jgi:ribonuclease HII